MPCATFEVAFDRSYKWDTLPAAQRPERGLLAIRAGLNAFANLRPAIVPRQLADASPLKVMLLPCLACVPHSGLLATRCPAFVSTPNLIPPTHSVSWLRVSTF